MRKFLIPEVVQVSGMDCGPASLKALLEGFRIPVSYGRLREACQTGIDGASIDTMEVVANQLGLCAEQIMLPADHIFLPAANALPAIAVVALPNGLTHFVVLWRRHGPMLQIMDPSAGRRWIRCGQFVNELYRHTMAVPETDWLEFAASDEFQAALRQRLQALGIAKRRALQFTQLAWQHPTSQKTWHKLGAIDAATRLASVLARSGSIKKGAEAERFLASVIDNPALIPDRFWSVSAAPSDEGVPQVFTQGAVLVRVTGLGKVAAAEDLGPELAAAIGPSSTRQTVNLFKFLRQSGVTVSALLVPATLIAAAAVLIEALLFRGLFDVAADLSLPLQRLGAMAAVILFCLVILLFEIPALSLALRLGRQMELRLRAAFLEKLPKLSDRYFQSRLTSDMAERSHAIHRVRHLPELFRQMLRTGCELGFTALGIVWLEPSALPWLVLILLAAVLPAFVTQPMLAERDLRGRSHAAALTRFYLDAMLGLTAIRAHGAGRRIRTEHGKLLGAWAEAALQLQRAVVGAEAFQLITTFGLAASLLLLRPQNSQDLGRVLLIIYWILNLPVLGQELGVLARQYPFYRNVTLRLLEPFGAPEEPPAPTGAVASESPAARVEFDAAQVEVCGHRILDAVNCVIEAGTHVAVVGSSGAGKSSLAAVLLGFLQPTQGAVLIDGQPLCAETLRSWTVWVDPAVRLWNRSLLENLTYGASDPNGPIGQKIDAASLRSVLEKLPDGLQTRLGEGGGMVSGGEAQRVRFGRAILRRDVRLVILDEPFRGLDREKRRELLARAREIWRNCTLICITHDIAETAAFDRVLVVEQGRVAEDGTPAELKAAAGSRYSELIEAERHIRSDLWSSPIWRRLRVQGGRVVEEVPPASEEEPGELDAA